MSTRLVVGNLSWAVNENTFHEAFLDYGEIASVIVPRDDEAGRSRGFGFVSFVDEQSAQAAVAALNGQEFDGEKMNVSMTQ